jgi:two-component system NarL family response regulator
LTVIMQAIAAGSDVPQIFDIIAQQAERLVPHDALIVLLRPDVSDYREATSSKTGMNTDDARNIGVAFCNPPVLEDGPVLYFSDFSFGASLLANQSVIVADLAAGTDRYAGDRLLSEAGGHAAVVVPVAVVSHILGGLAVVSRTPGVYSPEHLLLVEPVANLLAVALEHRRLDERARTLAVVEERNRMAREIHDTLAQSLAGIIINLEALKATGAEQGSDEANVLAETETLARSALEEARRSVMGLQPTPLQHQSLRDALSVELSGLGKRAALTTQLYVHGLERPLAPDLATALFRIAQEAFQNIHKHAAARNVILGLAFEGSSVVLTVEDDGVGFVGAPSEVTRDSSSSAIADATPRADATANDAAGSQTATRPRGGSGFGLMSMEARARILGGELLVTSHPGHGTAIRTRLPYSPPGGPAPLAIMLPGPVPEDTAEPSLDLHRPRSSELPQSANTIRVLIVDDHSIVRQGIRRILEEQQDIQVVGEAEDGLAAVEQAGELHPDVVLLDLQLPGLSGIEALPRLRAAHPGIEAILLTVFAQDEDVFEALKAGARGYLLKDATPDAVLTAVRAAGRGESSLAPELATRVMDRFAVLARREVDPDALTEREVEILGCMAEGMPYKQIGAQLNITAKTVQYHVRNILQKLHVGSRGEAVAVATQRGLLGRA